nr:hypothetical protein DM860_008914 [Ipomoea trifida]
MRALLLLFVTFSFEFVPLAFSSRMLPSSSSSSSDAVVVDFKGGQLKLGEPYYTLSSASVQQAEGLCLDDIKPNETSTGCPHNVFSGVTGSCAKETVWGLTFEDNETTSEFVTTDPAAPPVEFQLKKQGSGYAIVYCEIIPLPRIPVCFSIGFRQYGLYYSRLVVGLDIEPVEFFFVKKTTDVTPMPLPS